MERTGWTVLRISQHVRHRTTRTGAFRDRPRALRDRESDTYSPDDLRVSACGRAINDATVRSLYRIAQHGPRVAASRARATVRPWVLSLTRGFSRGGVISPLAGATGASGRHRSAACTSSPRTVPSP